jgi:hypothetical protein
MNEVIFSKALVSANPQAVLDVAYAFHDLGELNRSNALLQHACDLGYLFRGIWPPTYGFGVDYTAVQQKLNSLGANPVLADDGIWGPKSKTALIAYQKSKGLSADGIPGPNTLKALGISESSQVVSSTMGHAAPSTTSADAVAYAAGKKAGKEMGLTEKEVQYVVSVARGEGYYGYGWSHPSAKTLTLSQQFGLTGYEGANSNNWGAVQGSANAGSFPHVDVHADGTPYKANYKAYATPSDAFKDMAKTILGGGPIRKAVGAKEIKDAIAAGNLRKAVFAQHANGYFELNPESYLTAVLSNYNKILAGVQWPKVLAENGITPTIAAIGGGGLILGIGALAALIIFRKPLLSGLVH